MEEPETNIIIYFTSHFNAHSQHRGDVPLIFFPPVLNEGSKDSSYSLSGYLLKTSRDRP